jgi:predicted ester cyclase
MRLIAIAVTAVLPLAWVSACATEQRDESARAARTAFEEYINNVFWIQRDTTALARGLSPDMLYHYNGIDRPGDPAAHCRSLRVFGRAFPDLRASIDQFTDSGDLAAAWTTWSGRFEGPLCATPGTGRQVTWVVSYMFRIRNGRIVELWEAWDEGGTYRALGIDAAKCGQRPAT